MEMITRNEIIKRCVLVAINSKLTIFLVIVFTPVRISSSYYSNERVTAAFPRNEPNVFYFLFGILTMLFGARMMMFLLSNNVLRRRQNLATQIRKY
jgi:hypothetical protein